MNKKEIKELFAIVLFGFINVIISFSITSLLGISNIVVFHSISTLYGDITWEVIIFIGLYLIESLIYGFCSGEIKELFDSNY